MAGFKGTCCVLLILIMASLVGCGGSSSGSTGSPSSGGTGDTTGTGDGGGTEGPPPLTLTPLSIKRFHFSWEEVAGADEYRLFENPDGVSGYTRIATVQQGVTSHTVEVFLPGRINAQYLLEACDASGCETVSEVAVSGTLTEAVGYIKSANAEENDQFAWAVSLSGDGNTMAVGAVFEDGGSTGINEPADSNGSSGSGAVYVFSHENGSWHQQAYVKASNTGASDSFGSSVALSHNGNVLAVGADGEASNATSINGDETDNSADASGAVYVFTRTGTTWEQEAYIKASNAEAGDRFGYSVALSKEADTLAVGAYGESSGTGGVNSNQSDNSADFAGAVYVFTRTSSTWQQEAYIKASNPEETDFFGWTTALSGNGDTLAVGAPNEDGSAGDVDGDDSDNSAPDSGAAYVFVRDNGTWLQQGYIKASNTDGGDSFGNSVSLSADGNTLAIGATGEDSDATDVDGAQGNANSTLNSGAAYLFKRENNAWHQRVYIKASNTGEGDRFGRSVALSDNGDILAVGASAEQSSAVGLNGDQNDNSLTNSGAVYVFGRSNTVWRQLAYVKASNNGLGAEPRFGHFLALSGVGETLAVGAWSEDGAATGIDGDQTACCSDDSGAVYIF